MSKRARAATQSELVIDSAHLERVYSGYASIYDSIFGRAFRVSREPVVRSLEFAAGERVLEVGVGTGLCLPLYPRHCDITAIDLSEAMLEQAKESVAAQSMENVRLLRMDAAQTSFADSSFDVVIAAYVVTAVPDYRKLMAEMVRVTRPGGRLVLLNHFTSDLRLLAACERAISPMCVRFGFRSDLSVEDVLDGWPLVVKRHEYLKPFRLWRVLECENRKGG